MSAAAPRHGTEAARTAPAARRAAEIVAGVLLALGAAVAADAQPVPSSVFGVGERLEYRARIPGVGSIGRGVLAVQADEVVRGVAAHHLVFSFHGRVALARLEDRTESWLDPRAMTSLRYRKRERSPAGSRAEAVELYPGEGRWQANDGASEPLPTTQPLDELSFLYFIRTLPLNAGEEYTLARHYDAARNPVTVRVLGRGTLTVPAGTFRVIQVEMRVRDPNRFGGEGVLRLHLTDDARRIPVRISTSMPVAGAVVLELERAVEICPTRPGNPSTIALEPSPVRVAADSRQCGPS